MRYDDPRLRRLLAQAGRLAVSAEAPGTTPAEPAGRVAFEGFRGKSWRSTGSPGMRGRTFRVGR